MLAAWARDKDENLIQLCIRTNFRPTFEVSIKKASQLEYDVAQDPL